VAAAIAAKSHSAVVHPGLDFSPATGRASYVDSPADIPGLKEAGYDPAAAIKAQV
jgi:hypothetical protein